MEKFMFELVEDGIGGMIIDFGMIIMYLEEVVFNILKREFIFWMSLLVDELGFIGFDLCYMLFNEVKNLVVFKFVFYFKGVDLEFFGENYMVEDLSMGVLCLVMGKFNGMFIFGNF